MLMMLPRLSTGGSERMEEKVFWSESRLIDSLQIVRR